MSEAKKELTKKAEYDINYAKTKIKRVPLDMQISEYDRVKAAALGCGEKVNEYIKKAIRQRMEQEMDEINTVEE